MINQNFLKFIILVFFMYFNAEFIYSMEKIDEVTKQKNLDELHMALNRYENLLKEALVEQINNQRLIQEIQHQIKVIKDTIKNF